MTAMTIHDLTVPSSALHWAKYNQNGRLELELQVKTGFAKAYAADLHEFYPLLSCLNTPQGYCVLGLRIATTDTLFVEQYLEQPVENFLPQCTHRSEIAELGNLYSTHRSATLGHFIVVAQALLSQHIRFLTFTGTMQVRKLMALCQVPICELTPAQPSKVASAKDYGSYYDADPKVCVVDLENVQQVINTTKLYTKLAEQYRNEVSELVSGLQL
ncbi:thermostable hemolysin [Pseudoalteromonas sp. JBTF-M23]|uniref:Thermostable hemolysin n=1 Tax=Pseudoalteromonas caenipelagi TaxID=2726988 RepID=A0A849VBX1_9GAMM|nr:thermostable hemolysin [Pseudoalteromonas caenipelagi]NOU50525.1 thermostable hemolysin [Pseudoalteromonas caenipelagi]